MNQVEKLCRRAELRFVNMAYWLYPTTGKAAGFTAGFESTIDLLKNEMDALICIRREFFMVWNPGDLGAGGYPLAAAMRWGPVRPGVAVRAWSKSDARELDLHCDAYERWQDNVRAIARTLEAARTIELLQVGGCRAVWPVWAPAAKEPPKREAPRQEPPRPEPPKTAGSSGPGAKPWRWTGEGRYLAAAIGVCTAAGCMTQDTVHNVLTSPDELSRVWRTAAYKLHPDRGGNAAQFRAVNEQVELLRQMHE
jgi:hypothetical protein